MNRALIYKELRTRAPITTLGTRAGALMVIEAFLFLWIPCGTRNIRFPLLFAPPSGRRIGCCHDHG